MFRCGACDNPDKGYQHTCAGSGTWAAAEAYDAEAVLQQASADWPYFDAEVTFRIRASDEHQVREKLTPLVVKLLGDDFVEQSSFTIELVERTAA